jgi:hypothetical protein
VFRFILLSSLFHGSLTDHIETLEPRKRYTPGGEENSPSGIYASDDPAFAAAHAFPWSSVEGVDLYYELEGDKFEHVLEVPESLKTRLEQPIFIYEVSAKNFELLNISPAGHNYRSLEPTKCLGKKRFETVSGGIHSYGGIVKIKSNK